MNSQTFFRERLSHRFLELKGKNPRYSLRAFARDLNQNPAAISQIFRSKRRVSKAFALDMGKRIGLPLEDLDTLTKLFDDDSSFKSITTAPITTINHRRQSLELEMYDIVVDWVYYAILSLSETKDFVGNAVWIADRLGISVNKSKNCIERLLDLGFLKTDDNNGLVHNANVCTVDNITNLALRKRHELNLDDARSSIYRDSVDDRDFTFVTMVVDPRRIAGAKKMIREFQNRLCNYLEGGESSEVYEICTQLFPRTKLRNNHAKENV